MKANLNLLNTNLNNTSYNKTPKVSYGVSYQGLSADKFELSSNSAKGGVKNLLDKFKNLFLSNPTPKTSNLNPLPASNQISFQGKKKDYNTTVIYSKDVEAAKRAKETYFNKFNADLKEAQTALELVDEDLALQIKQSHDLFKPGEICDMQDAKDSLDKFSLSEIVKKRGAYEKLMQPDVSSEADMVLAKDLNEYVNRFVEFCSQDKNRAALYNARIEELISRYGKTPEETTLYRGVLSDFEITRLFNLLEVKQQNPQETILYYPKRLTSVTKNPSVTAKSYGQKCMMEIEIPQNADKNSIKLLDINDIFKKLNLKRNKFEYQEELLVGSKYAFAVKGLKFVNNIPTFIVKLVKSGV